MSKSEKSPRNKTLAVSNSETLRLGKSLLTFSKKVGLPEIKNKTINQDIFKTLELLPDEFVDLVVVDPPYNLTKKFNESVFREKDEAEYTNWIESWLSKLPRLMKNNSTIYVCCDWKSSSAIYNVLSKYFIVRNRITWEREKGRGAKTNWKNCSEDIWFATKSNDYYFDPEKVKLKKKVIAPYKTNEGTPKDWSETAEGNYRLTFPSNLWTDITIPFWSMPENTEHPTQKPEKLIAKLILASSKKGDFVFDPFLGSGTTSVVAKKLGRDYCGIEVEKEYAVLAEKRLTLASAKKEIQGYRDGIFWERNSLTEQMVKSKKSKSSATENDISLFEVE